METKDRTIVSASNDVIFQTENYEVRLGDLQGETGSPVQANLRRVYFIRHRTHDVAATYSRTMPEAITMARALEYAAEKAVTQTLDELMEGPATALARKPFSGIVN